MTNYEEHFLQSPKALLGTLQLADSLFPSGRYTLSHGLEMFVESGQVKDAESLERVVMDYLTATVGRCEAVAVANANQAAFDGDLDTVFAVDELLHALRLPWETSSASVRSGRQLIVTGSRLVDDEGLAKLSDAVTNGETPGSHSVVFGVVSNAFGIDARTAVLAELYAWTAALIGSALRLIRLDHVDAQAILLKLQPEMAVAAERALHTHYEDMEAFAPAVDIRQMQHERSRMRMFAS